MCSQLPHRCILGKLLFEMYTKLHRTVELIIGPMLAVIIRVWYYVLSLRRIRGKCLEERPLWHNYGHISTPPVLLRNTDIVTGPEVGTVVVDRGVELLQLSQRDAILLLDGPAAISRFHKIVASAVTGCPGHLRLEPRGGARGCRRGMRCPRDVNTDVVIQPQAPAACS